MKSPSSVHVRIVQELKFFMSERRERMWDFIMAKENKLNPEMLIILIVGIVASVGIIVLLINAGGSWGGGDFTGQATSSTGCSDTESGSNTKTGGTVTYGGKSYPDTCSSDMTSLTEYYCENKANKKSESYTCAGYCTADATTGKGDICLDECYESDDGRDSETKGTVVYAGKTKTDSCRDDKGESDIILKEWYCDSKGSTTTLSSSDTDCSNKGTGYYCSNGACVPPSCTDTDGGKESGTYGEVTLNYGDTSSSSFDTCSDDGITLTEKYCYSTGNSIQTTKVDCSAEGEGYVCNEGKCEKLSGTCYDEDGGYNLDEKGTIIGYELVTSDVGGYEYKGTAKTDECISQGRSLGSDKENFVLYEYTCDSTTKVIEKDNYDCEDKGEVCEDGACAGVCTHDQDSLCGAYTCNSGPGENKCYTDCSNGNECKENSDGNYYQCNSDVCYKECATTDDCDSGYKCQNNDYTKSSTSMKGFCIVTSTASTKTTKTATNFK